MNHITTFIVYLTIFRVSIIAAGIVSIVLGYRLFCKGILPEAGYGNETSMHANLGEYRFTLRNAAPGTFFALFGVIIISVMLISGSPEMTLELLDRSGAGGTALNFENGESNAPIMAAGMEHKTTVRLRGDDVNDLKAATEKGKTFEKMEQYDEAMAAYQDALNLMADPMNYLAWLWNSHGESARALPLARMAVTLAPDNANFLDTLAQILFKTGEYDEAVKVMERAMIQDPKPDYKKSLETFRKADRSPE